MYCQRKGLGGISGDFTSAGYIMDCRWKDGIDLAKAMEVLYERFGVKRLGLLGGGHINGGFLEAGLIDEVSLLLAPDIDGRTGETSLFDGISDKGRMPVQLRLEQVKKLKNDVLWIRYKL